MAVSLIAILSISALSTYIFWVPPPPPPPPPLSIAIDGDADFAATALLEGWPGDGSSENPYIIDGLGIDLGNEDGNCIMINNTRVSFTISNCNLTGANNQMMEGGCAGILLFNVFNGELVNNTCNNNKIGIYLIESDSNTVADNTCTSKTRTDNNNY